MIGPWKMKPVATLIVTVNHNSPVVEMVTKRNDRWSTEESVVFYENARGKRKVKASDERIVEHPYIVRWLVGGEFPPGVRKL